MDPQPGESQAASGNATAARSVLAHATSFLAAANAVLAAPQQLRRRAREQHEWLRDQEARRLLREMPIDRLREASSGQVRLSGLEKAGVRTVLDVVSLSVEELQRYPGVGQKTAQQVRRAADALAGSARKQAVFRFDADHPDPAQEHLLGTLRALEVAEREVGELGQTVHPLTGLVEGLHKRARRAGSRVRMFFSTSRKKSEAREALGELANVLRRPLAERTFAAARRVGEAAGRDGRSPWSDYRQRAATYNTLLGRVTGEDSAESPASREEMPREIRQQISAISLDTGRLRVSLRGYQEFGAKFALARRLTILGDEMGLGKTIEALAVLAHLTASGRRHFLVVCPAGVLVNWASEVVEHSRLDVHVLHGRDRDERTHEWVRAGGVAVTTYDTLRRLPDFQQVRLGLVVVDEAHYIKNPDVKRSRTVAAHVRRAEHALLLTGTPMENRVEEFKQLISYLQPDIARKIRTQDALMDPRAFRRTVAPVYLRRNQEDVLTELPEKLELDDWVELGEADGRAYRKAVADGSFMAMRRAACAPGTVEGSEKLDRLHDIVEESAANGWKVVVFSYFLDVLEAVRTVVGPMSMPPLTGKLSPEAKQQLVDRFSAHDGPAVLPCQINAGGVGMNIQAASVVVITEPQLKPSTEAQAIARCHRMGQTRKVHVHRLMAKDTVDQRLQEILEGKTRLFDAYARESTTKDRNTAATDVTTLNQDLLHDTAIPMDQRIVQVERQRLHLD
ncbi:DEAD/DEAH box helicase [Saccharopolyspora flava]|uniref:Superfamily II DNA or RNA helicase, SNF2 family n=1 Tax=Saccharopolyspora flava TaxID=95161 RepID=A0A1I6RM54_9PSEU|nr:SNF2-related protein [Saccharopolyspora flava]SFS65772.1 Superfamily II DNA or RNA helicase, SNF2 family [Saccharopolyspora flava]